MALSDSKQDHSIPDASHLESLLDRLTTGDTAAFEAFYNDTRASVYGFVYSIVHQQHDAEDVLHDTYVAIYQSAARYEARGKPMAWVLTIAKNLALMKLRDRNRIMALSDTDQANLAAENPKWSIEDKLLMQTYLQELSEDEQMIVTLRAVSGWKHREIAKFMEKPLQHVIVKYNRSIKKLMRKLT